MWDPKAERQRWLVSRLIGGSATSDCRGERGTEIETRCASVGPTHEPQVEAEGMLKELRQCFEYVLQGVPEGMWAHIQDEGVLE
jgi:hypothetical protein